MAKVQFNCRLDRDVAEWIAGEANAQTTKRASKFSQADVVTLLVNEEQNAREVTPYTPKIEAKIKKNATPRVNRIRQKGDKTR